VRSLAATAATTGSGIGSVSLGRSDQIAVASAPISQKGRKYCSEMKTAHDAATTSETRSAWARPGGPRPSRFAVVRRAKTCPR
jgi:hypothetical protein